LQQTEHAMLKRRLDLSNIVGICAAPEIDAGQCIGQGCSKRSLS